MTLDVKNFSPEVRNFLFTSGLVEDAKRQIQTARMLQQSLLQDIKKNLIFGGSTGDKLTDFVFTLYSDVNVIAKKLKEFESLQERLQCHAGEYMLVEIWEKHGDDVMYACGTHELKATYICLIKEGMNFSFDFTHCRGTYNGNAIYLGNNVNDDSDIFAVPKPIGIASDSNLKYNFIVGDHEVRKKLRSLRLFRTIFFGDIKINVLNFKMYIIMNMLGRNIPNMICEKRLDQVKRLWIDKIKEHNAPPKKSIRLFNDTYAVDKRLKEFELLKNISTHAKLGIEVIEKGKS